MIAEISSLITSSRVAYDIAKGLTSVYVDDKVRDRTSELLGILLTVQADALSVQSKHQEVLKEKDNLEKKIIEFENWAETERNHETAEVIPDIRVYIAKGLDHHARQSANWYCTNCWTDKVQSILHLKAKGSALISYFCPKCKTIFSHYPPQEPLHSQRTHRGDFM